MGQKTRDELVSEGLLKAGDTSLTARANIWLNAKLRELYASWPWPFLQKRTSGITLAAGTQSLTFGNGSSEALEVKHIYDPIVVYRSDYSFQGYGRVRAFLEHDLSRDEVINNPATNVGPPSLFRVMPSNTVWGTWSLKPNPIPDKAYLLSIDYIIQPADLSSGVSVPVYPSDETLIQAVYAAALKFMSDANSGSGIEAYKVADADLTEMAMSDRMRYGSVPGINDSLQLDPDTFG